MSRSTLNDAVAKHFTANRRRWVNARVLARIGGFAAWRTRVSNLRTERGMRIRNRVTRVIARNATITVSEYRYEGRA